MSYPRFLHKPLPQSGVVSLEEVEAHHARQVLRVSEGAEVVLFDGSGGEALAVVELVGKRGLDAQIVRRLDRNRELQQPLEMFVALPKGDRQKVLIDGLVQMGVTRLTPLICDRGVVQPSSGAVERLQRNVVESSKQCGRNYLMEICQPLHLGDLPNAAPESPALFAHPYGSQIPLSEFGRSPFSGGTVEESVVLKAAIGPEGGFTDSEVAHFESLKWQSAWLGPRILRIEMAAIQIAAWWASHGLEKR